MTFPRNYAKLKEIPHERSHTITMRTAAIFSSHMVLQQGRPICIWGEGQDGEHISVTLGNVGAETVAANGKWKLYLPPQTAADGLTMTIAGKDERLVFTDISIGEVWLCGGQSNMEFEICNEKNGEALLSALTPDCGVRFYYTPKLHMIDANFDAAERSTCWQTASPTAARAWSAVGLYCALELQKKLGVTVGLIGCNWGGTSATSWIPRETIAEHPQLSPYLDDYDRAMEGVTLEEHIRAFDAYAAYQGAWHLKSTAYKKAHPDASWEDIEAACGKSQYPGPMGPKSERRPGGLYETMLSRVCPYTLRGFLFYQGESDACYPDTYGILLRALIAKWRKDWENPDLPFLFVQLPMFRYASEPDSGSWAVIREHQMQTAQTVANTALAIIPDCGEWNEIHPSDKSQVGHRLALLALAEVYGLLPQTQAHPPVYQSYEIIGDTMILHFANGVLAPCNDPCGFELAGADGIFYPACTKNSADTVTLHAEQVPCPTAARYAWADYCAISLYGENGLPVSPFRTAKA